MPLFNVVIECFNRHTEFRMVGEEYVGGLDLFEQRGDKRINAMYFGSRFINTRSERGTELFIIALGCVSIVVILRWYGA